MKQKKVKSKGLILKIDPSIPEIKIISGEKFFYSSILKEFQIDENSYGEPICKPLKGLNLIEQKLDFISNYRGENIHFLIDSKYEADKVTYPYFIKIPKGNFSFSPSDTDGIEITFNKNKLETIIITRYEDNVSKKFLTILLDNEKSIITYPFKKYSLKTIRIDGRIFIFETDSEIIQWELKVHSLILSLVKELVGNAGLCYNPITN